MNTIIYLVLNRVNINAKSLILKFAPSKVVWGLFDTEKKLYMCPFGPEPIAGTKMQELFPGLILQSAIQ